MAVNSKKWHFGPGTLQAGFPTSLGIGYEGQAFSDFLASTVG